MNELQSCRLELSRLNDEIALIYQNNIQVDTPKPCQDDAYEWSSSCATTAIVIRFGNYQENIISLFDLLDHSDKQEFYIIKMRRYRECIRDLKSLFNTTKADIDFQPSLCEFERLRKKMDTAHYCEVNTFKKLNTTWEKDIDIRTQGHFVEVGVPVLEFTYIYYSVFGPFKDENENELISAEDLRIKKQLQKSLLMMVEYSENNLYSVWTSYLDVIRSKQFPFVLKRKLFEGLLMIYQRLPEMALFRSAQETKAELKQMVKEYVAGLP